MHKTMLSIVRVSLAILAATMVGCAVDPISDGPLIVHVREAGVEAAVYTLGEAGEIRTSRTAGIDGQTELLSCFYGKNGLLDYATREDAATGRSLGTVSTRTVAAAATDDSRPAGLERRLTDPVGLTTLAVATYYYGPDGGLVGLMQVDAYGNVLSQGAADAVPSGRAIAPDAASRAVSARGIIADEGGGLQDRFMNSVIDLRSEVIDFRPDGLAGMIRGGVLVRPSPGDLAVGSVFIDADGVARRAAAVSRQGRNLYVDAVRPAPEEVFLYVSIPYQTVSFAAAAASLGESVGSEDGAGRGTINIASIEKELYKSADEHTVIRLAFGGSITSDVSIGMIWPSVVLTSWKVWLASSYRQDYGYIGGALSWGVDLNGAVSFTLEGALQPKDPFMIKGLGTPKVGIEAEAGIYFRPSLEGSLTLSIPFTFGLEGSAGASCTLAGNAPVIWPTDVRGWGGNTDFHVSLDPSIEGAVTAKMKFFLGAKVKVIGITMTEFEAGGGPYLKVAGSASASIGYDTGLAPPAGPAFATGELALSGEFGVFTGISGKVYDGKWTLNLLANEFPVWTFLDLSTDQDKDAAARVLNIPYLVGAASPAGAF